MIFFFFAGRDNKCFRLLHAFESICGNLSVPIADDKTEGPNTKLSFLGLEIDTDDMTVRIPQEKVAEIITKINGLMLQKKTTLRDLQSLIGSLNFVCRAIKPGRPFIRRLIDATRGVSKPNFRIRVTREMKSDLNMWLVFFDQFNGISVFNDKLWVSNAHIQLFTDSLGKRRNGFGTCLGNQWAYAKFPDSWYQRDMLGDITFLEFFPILVSVYIWGNQLRNKKIIFRCDNKSVCHIINSLTSKSGRVMTLVRKFTLVILEYNIVCKSEHIRGIHNELTCMCMKSLHAIFAFKGILLSV